MRMVARMLAAWIILRRDEYDVDVDSGEDVLE